MTKEVYNILEQRDQTAPGGASKWDIQIRTLVILSGTYLQVADGVRTWLEGLDRLAAAKETCPMSEAWSMRLGAACRMAAIAISVLAGDCSPRCHGPAPTLRPSDRACTTNIISSSKMRGKER